MPSLVDDIKNWNTPIIGAYHLWRFTEGYTKNHSHGEAPVALLHFIALAVLTGRSLSERISNRRKDLPSYIKSFEDNKDFDHLMSIHTRISDKKTYTLSCIDMAISKGLLVWNIEDGRIYYRDVAAKPKRGNALKKDIKLIGDRSEILGKWFSEYEVNQIAAFLKVVL